MLMATSVCAGTFSMWGMNKFATTIKIETYKDYGTCVDELAYQVRKYRNVTCTEPGIYNMWGVNKFATTIKIQTYQNYGLCVDALTYQMKRYRKVTCVHY